jgi:hypothetical protein
MVMSFTYNKTIGAKKFSQGSFIPLANPTTGALALLLKH